MREQTPTTQEPSTSQAPALRRIFTALLVIGVSGSGKTSLLKTFAEYLWETHKKILLLYSWDGGAIPTGVQHRMNQGLIRFWRARTRSAPGLGLETLHFATKGYWPQTINPRTGETTPAVKLIAPVTTKYHLYASDGRLLKTVPSAQLIKPTQDPKTNAMLSLDQMTVKEEVYRTKGFEMVGGVAYDGITSMADVVMDNQDQLRGAGLIGGEKSSFGGNVVSGDIRFGGNNRADVGFAQTRAAQFVNNTLGIPYLLESPVFTGLSTEGTDKGGLSVIGVDLPGQAALTQAPQWFGNICEADSLTDDEGPHFCLNLKKFTDAQGRQHLLKTSASPGGVPDRLIDPATKEERPFQQFNLGVLFKLLDEDLRRAMALNDLPDAPGMAQGLLEVGEPMTVTEALTPPRAAAAPSAAASPSPSVAPAAGKPGASAASAAPKAVAPAPAATPVAPAAAPVVQRAAAPAATAAKVAAPPGMKPPARAPQAPKT